MTDKLKENLILIPSFHAATCIIYVFFYYYAFGQGLVYFASPTDVFSVSLGDVAPAYLWLLLGVFIAHVAFRHPEKGNVFRFDTLTDEEKEKQAPKYASMNRYVTKLIILTSIIPVTVSILYYISSGFVQYFFAGMALQIFVILFNGWALNRFSMSKTFYDVGSVTTLVFVALMLSAMRDAQSDKFMKFEDYDQPRMRCGNYVILRNVAEYSLAVSKDNARTLIDSDCKAKFIVSTSKEFTPLPDGAPADVIKRLF